MPVTKHILFIAGNARSLVANRGDLIAAMHAAGHRVSAAVPVEDYLPSVENLGISIHTFRLGRTGLNPLADLSMLLSLINLIRSINPDIVFSYTVKPATFGSIAAWLAGVPRRYAMVTGLGTVFLSGISIRANLVRQLVVRLYQIGLACCDRVFFQNPDDIAEFNKRYIIRDSSKIVRTMGSGVNLTYFSRQPLPAGSPVFLVIARLIWDKGIDEFVAAASALKKNAQSARFVIVGPHDPSLPRAIPIETLESWKSAGAVEFGGGASDVRDWLATCTVLVLPSYREGTPRSVLEAMATGRPIITTDAPGCRETVRDGENGFLVPPRDASALAAAMQRFLDEPELVARMADASYERVKSDYDVNKVNAVILQAMELA